MNKIYEQISRSLEDIAACIRLIGEEPETVNEFNAGAGKEIISPDPVEEPKVSLEDIRLVLATKSKAGKTAQVKALLSKYGVAKLSALDEAHYNDMLKEGEAL